jgi:fructokinase
MGLSTKKDSGAVCFGEVLWDVFPGGAKPGGAPLNVAYHLRQLGVNCEMISRTGADERGRDLLNIIAAWGFDLRYIGTDQDHLTSTVDLFTDEHNDVSYAIHENVAWDHIPADPAYIAKVKEDGVLVFGSLSMRSRTSYETLLQLLEVCETKVMDVNIRMPFFDIDKIEKVLYKTDILKLNKAELNQMVIALGADLEADEDKGVNFLREKFNIDEVLLTKGSKGARYYRGENSYFQDAYKIEICDTVGSGDAFLAGFLAKWLRPEKNAAAMLDYASAIGAFNTTKAGACPPYTIDELDRFIAHHKTKIA